MFRFVRRLLLLALIAALVWGSGIVSDKKTLQSDVVRLHIVAASDSQEDQALKLQIRDAVTAHLETVLDGVTQSEDAAQVIRQELDQIKSIAGDVLAQAGVSDSVAVRFVSECFDTREYDTFTLPAGVYQSLRIEVGQAEGQNWWCVVFPALCTKTVSQEVCDAAVGAGFSQGLSGAVTGAQGQEIRFFILDCWGKIENFFHRA